jgi:hypothetical protein
MRLLLCKKNIYIVLLQIHTSDEQRVIYDMWKGVHVYTHIYAYKYIYIYIYSYL